jgi:L-alanine-DL-glutamate epimerase-like enolase superfamily enzyme
MPWKSTSPSPSDAGSAVESVEITSVEITAYAVPTDRPESDGTFEWETTTVVVAEVRAASETGLGYTYADLGAATLAARTLADVVVGLDATDVPAAWNAMNRVVRNAGRPGVAATAIAALDCALWDLKARLLGVPLVRLLGGARAEVPIYGSGGFTSYPVDVLERQLAGWVEAGIRGVKMKVGRDAVADLVRVRAARTAIGSEAGLFVDANGAWTPGRALEMARRFSPYAVSWFEEPVSSDDLAGLRRVRDGAPSGMEIAAGEYGFDSRYFRRMLQGGAVDVLQADATRCGLTGFLEAGALCEAFGVPLSAHTAPALHVAPGCALSRVRHVEYFHDHVRVEPLLFDGVPQARQGTLRPDLTRPGLGLELKRTDAARYRVL